MCFHLYLYQCIRQKKLNSYPIIPQNISHKQVILTPVFQSPSCKLDMNDLKQWLEGLVKQQFWSGFVKLASIFQFQNQNIHHLDMAAKN